MGAPALIAVSAGMQAAGGLIGGISKRNQAQFQAELARRNARLAQQRGEVQRARLGREHRRAMGRARNIAASRGVTLAGSPLDVLADQAAEAAEEQALIQFGGDVAATEQRARARSFDVAGRQALIGGVMGAGSSLLGGLGESGALVNQQNSANSNNALDPLRGRRRRDFARSGSRIGGVGRNSLPSFGTGGFRVM